MNNHWFTNFPLTQDGPVTFRYRILPHGAYNAATANRFGLEQAQPLVALAADKNPITKPLIAIEGAPAVTVSSMKSSGDGKSVIIRLRSVSDKPETVRLTWPAGMPQLVSLCEREECPSAKIDGEIVVPAMGMVVLKAVW
jgi:alpha-mannosidase